MGRTRPHVLGIDDGPVRKHGREGVVVVGVVMEGSDLVEGVAITRFPVDGDGATPFLVGWIRDLRFHPALHGIVLGGITIAGLGVVDISSLSREVGVPVMAVNRKNPANHRLHDALRAAGLPERMEVVDRTPGAVRLPAGVWLSCAGTDPDAAANLVSACTAKAVLPEPLRLAHLIARAVSTGESRGRA